jgi:hypothetical protein
MVALLELLDPVGQACTTVLVTCVACLVHWLAHAMSVAMVCYFFIHAVQQMLPMQCALLDLLLVHPQEWAVGSSHDTCQV